MNKIDDNYYQPDFSIADKYINFSSEILRLSLLGISGVATFLSYYLKGDKCNCIKIELPEKTVLIITLFFFTISAGFSLAHRFYATDSLSYLIANLRTQSQNEKTGLRKTLKKAENMLIYAEWFFAFGIIAFVFAVIIIINNL